MQTILNMVACERERPTHPPYDSNRKKEKGSRSREWMNECLFVWLMSLYFDNIIIEACLKFCIQHFTKFELFPDAHFFAIFCFRSRSLFSLLSYRSFSRTNNQIKFRSKMSLFLLFVYAKPYFPNKPNVIINIGFVCFLPACNNARCTLILTLSSSLAISSPHLFNLSPMNNDIFYHHTKDMKQHQNKWCRGNVRNSISI